MANLNLQWDSGDKLKQKNIYFPPSSELMTVISSVCYSIDCIYSIVGHWLHLEASSVAAVKM